MALWLAMPIDCKKETPLAAGRVYRCTACAYGALLPRPDASELRDAYRLERYYTHGSSHFAAAGRRTLLDRVREHLAWRADRGHGVAAGQMHALLGGRRSAVCDIGCGGGALAGELSALGHEVVGVDPDPAALAQAARGGVEVLQGSAEHLPAQLAARRFDLVVMSHVLEHCADPARALANAAALMRRGGLLLCEVPNNACAACAYAGLTWEMLDIPRHLNFFMPENLRAMALRAGLAPRRIYYRNYARQFRNDWINTERRIYEAIGRARHGADARPRPVKNSRARAWRLLARTLFARDELKYDSVGIVAALPA
jgi:2-polyprenyl-3-methyl-5-hydroxy-6-metoxy-1,4-benzoquinol methylase